MKPETIDLRAKLKEAIAAGVQATVKKSAGKLLIVSSATPPSKGIDHADPPFSKGSAATFKRRMINAKMWEPVREILAEERFDALLLAEMRRRERAATDPNQLLLPGFENLPRVMRVPMLSVKEFLVRAARYEKRANRNRVAGAEMARLADLIRDQPLDLTVPEALARATGSTGTSRAATKK
jgi:hypothetical protein